MSLEFPFLTVAQVTTQTDKSNLCQIKYSVVVTFPASGCSPLIIPGKAYAALPEPATFLDRKNALNSISAQAPAPLWLG